MTDPREALVALLWEKFGAGPNGPLAAWLTEADCARFADAILAAGWTPPGERVKPSVEDVARALAARWWSAPPGETEPWESLTPEEQTAVIENNAFDQIAPAVLALLPGRTEAEVKAEAWDEVADYLGRTNAPSLAEAARRDNPYRKEADRG